MQQAAAFTFPPSKRVRRTAETRRQEVVCAVVELARGSGPDGITTQAIADRIGLTHGALFRHFPDKAAMWAAVFEWVQVELGRVLDKAFSADAKPETVLQRVFLAHVDFIASHPGVPRILFNELQRPAGSPFRRQVQGMVGAYRERLRALFLAAKKTGQLSATLDEDAAAVLFIGAVQGLAVQSLLLGGRRDMRAAAQRIFPLLMHGFRGAPRTARGGTRK